MEHILYNLRAVATNIDYHMLIPNSYLLEDYNLVFDKRKIDYQSDDGGDQTDPRIGPINEYFLTMELRSPYCTPGVYNMSSQEFTESNLNAMSHWHTGTNRFAPD